MASSMFLMDRGGGCVKKTLSHRSRKAIIDTMAGMSQLVQQCESLTGAKQSSLSEFRGETPVFDHGLNERKAVQPSDPELKLASCYRSKFQVEDTLTSDSETRSLSHEPHGLLGQRLVRLG